MKLGSPAEVRNSIDVATAIQLRSYKYSFRQGPNTRAPIKAPDAERSAVSVPHTTRSVRSDIARAMSQVDKIVNHIVEILQIYVSTTHLLSARALS